MDNPKDTGLYPCIVLTHEGPHAHCCLWDGERWLWEEGMEWEPVTDCNCQVVAWEIPMANSDSVSVAVSDVMKERHHQDVKWGGPEHDDEHSAEDWERFIMQRIPVESEWGPAFRRRMVEIAALAIAAIESSDRREEKKSADAGGVAS